MKFTLELAKNAKFVPVAATISLNSQIISYATNTPEKSWYHAELLAIEKAQKVDLSLCEIYVTLEPCLFCSALLDMVKIKKIYFGAYNRLGIGLSSCIHKLSYLNANTEIIGGLYEADCQLLLSKYFKNQRCCPKSHLCF